MIILAPLFALPAIAQDKPADNMQILQQKVKADKKLVLATEMKLTDKEAKGFWPVYESYQRDLEKINQRLTKAISAYADGYNNNTLSDDQAKALTNEAITIEEDLSKLQKSYVPKLSNVLPGKKVARYLQIERKIRAMLNYELAKAIPLAE
jgi:hypothetical protein